MTLTPLSQSCPKDIRGWWRLGRIVAEEAGWGKCIPRCLKLSVAVCDDFITPPLGVRTVMRLCAPFLFVHGVCVGR